MAVNLAHQNNIGTSDGTNNTGTPDSIIGTSNCINNTGIPDGIAGTSDGTQPYNQVNLLPFQLVCL